MSHSACAFGPPETRRRLVPTSSLTAPSPVPLFFCSVAQAAVKKLSKSAAKSLNSMRQKLRKVCKGYESDLKKFRAAKIAKRADDDDDEEDGEDDDAGVAAPSKSQIEEERKRKNNVPTAMKQIKDYNEQEIDERLDELLGKRGKKNKKGGISKQEEISILQQLADATKRPSKAVELLGHTISFSFDLHNNMLTAMPVKVWKEVFKLFNRLLTTLVDNPELKIEQVEGTTAVDAKQMTAVEADDEDDDGEIIYKDTGVTQARAAAAQHLPCACILSSFLSMLPFCTPGHPPLSCRDSYDEAR